MKNFQGKKKRIFSALLATIVAAGMLSACGSGEAVRQMFQLLPNQGEARLQQLRIWGMV